MQKEDVWTLRENRSFSEQRKNSCDGSVFIHWMTLPSPNPEQVESFKEEAEEEVQLKLDI